METKFLTKKKSDNQRLIYFSFNADYSKILISTGLSVDSKDWQKGYPKKNNSTKEIRSQLDSWKVQIDEFIKGVVNNENRQPTKFELTQYINTLLGKKTTSSLISDHIQDYLKDCQKFANKTRLTKKQHLTHLTDFMGNRSISDLNSQIVKGYQKEVNQLNREVATLNGYIKDAKAFFKWLFENEHTTVNFGTYLKKHTIKEKQVIALTDNEFEVLENAELKSDRLQRVVDLFLFGCYTGLRYSDIQRVNKNIINANNEIELRQKKTSDLIRIPLINEAIQLLEKYNYELPQISNQKANDYLKEAFTLLRLTRKVTVSTQHVNGIKDKVKPLDKIISFHKARKTFITIALMRGVPAHIVKRLSGHKTDAVFNKYIAYTDEVMSEQIGKLSRSTRHLKAV